MCAAARSDLKEIKKDLSPVRFKGPKGRRRVLCSQKGGRHEDNGRNNGSRRGCLRISLLRLLRVLEWKLLYV